MSDVKTTVKLEEWRGFMARLIRAVEQNEMLSAMQDWRKFDTKISVLKEAQERMDKYNVEHFGEDKNLAPMVDYLKELDERIAAWDKNDYSKSLYLEGLVMATEQLRLYTSYLVPEVAKEQEWPWYNLS